MSLQEASDNNLVSKHPSNTPHLQFRKEVEMEIGLKTDTSKYATCWVSPPPSFFSWAEQNENLISHNGTLVLPTTINFL